MVDTLDVTRNLESWTIPLTAHAPRKRSMSIRDEKNTVFVCISSPSLTVAGEHGKCHALRAQKPQAISDWLNPLSLGAMSAFGYIEN